MPLRAFFSSFWMTSECDCTAHASACSRSAQGQAAVETHLRPVDAAAAALPQVHDVAHKVHALALRLTQEIQQRLRLAARGALQCGRAKETRTLSGAVHRRGWVAEARAPVRSAASRCHRRAARVRAAVPSRMRPKCLKARIIPLATRIRSKCRAPPAAFARTARIRTKCRSEMNMVRNLSFSALRSRFGGDVERSRGRAERSSADSTSRAGAASAPASSRMPRMSAGCCFGGCADDARSGATLALRPRRAAAREARSDALDGDAGSARGSATLPCWTSTTGMAKALGTEAGACGGSRRRVGTSPGQFLLYTALQAPRRAKNFPGAAMVAHAAGAGGLLACLSESEPLLQVHALKGLLKVVDQHWAEVSSAISRIEAFAEDDGFAERQLASLLASKARPRRRGARLASKPNGVAGVLPPGRAERRADVRAGRRRAVQRDGGVGVCDHAAGCGARRPAQLAEPCSRTRRRAQPRPSTSTWSCAASPTPTRPSRTRGWWPSWSACSTGAFQACTCLQPAAVLTRRAAAASPTGSTSRPSALRSSRAAWTSWSRRC